MKRARLAALCVTVLALPALAAEPKAQVAVVAGGDAENRLVVEAIWALRGAVDARKALAAVAIEERLADARTDPVEEGRAALAEGQQAFAELDLERAARALEMAARLLGGVQAEREAAVLALDLLAQTRSAARDELGAAVAYARLVKLDPSFRPDTDALGPAVQRAWKKARNLSASGRPGPLRIESSMVPAAVFINGRYAGVTPQLIARPESLAVEVTLRADGFAPWTRAIVLRPDTSAALEPTMEPLSKSPLLMDIEEKLPTQWERETMGTALKDLRSLLFADQAVLVGLKGGDLLVQLHDLKVGRRVRSLRWTLKGEGLGGDDAAALVDALYDGVDERAPGSTALAEEEPESLDGRPRMRIMDAWWFWPAVGVAAATAIAVPIFVLTGDEETAIAEHDGEGAVILRF